MENLTKYNETFAKIFTSHNGNLNDLKYQDIPEWDSIGHMELMSALENAFQIEIEIDDIIDFSSYVKGIEILKKYSIQI